MSKFTDSDLQPCFLSVIVLPPFVKNRFLFLCILTLLYNVQGTSIYKYQLGLIFFSRCPFPVMFYLILDFAPLWNKDPVVRASEVFLCLVDCIKGLKIQISIFMSFLVSYPDRLQQKRLDPYRDCGS
jgi:hypothetical protein